MSKYRIKVRDLIDSNRGYLRTIYEVQVKLFGLIWIELDYFWEEEQAVRYMNNKRLLSRTKPRYIE